MNSWWYVSAEIPKVQHDDGSVEILDEHFSQSMLVGHKVRFTDNRTQEHVAYGEVVEIQPGKVRVRLND